YGHSCHMNACPQLAEAGRIDLGMEEAETAVLSGRYQTVVLSQVLTALEEELLTAEDVVTLMDACPAHVALVLTGRTAPIIIAAQCEPWAEGNRLPGSVPLECSGANSSRRPSVNGCDEEHNLQLPRENRP
ncbi:MAG: cob(I)yrinic acid a,c-diamide adenosyltransferase, partial [Patescibacteria group bacterium]|nr:cob(I)yrinic acid a,c-diamide adenosyltransferase [Patescibacteria group bacterium]